ncbi:MAG: oligoendopeptidase F [Vicinamibacterales bacterium]|nr:oligoendopeptidase F [Vicinamibacterales bacterium]
MRITRSLIVGVMLAATSLTALAQERDRAKIPEKYRWDLTQIYASDAAWRAAKDKLQAEIPQLSSFKGRLGTSAETLAGALDRVFAMRKELSRLWTYASCQADQDTRDSEHQGMRQQMTQLDAELEAEASFIEPEILRVSRSALQSFAASQPRLKSTYKFYLDDLARRAEHTLSDAEEKILANMGPLAESPSNTFGLFVNADLPYPTVELSDGRKVRVDQAAFTELRALPNRSDREKVMAAYFQSFSSFSRTIGATMSGSVQRYALAAKTRKYGSDLEMRLDDPNIPPTVYSRLIDGVNRHLPTFHRYLKLRKRMLGVNELHYYDLYAPLVSSVDLKYTPEEAHRVVAAALAPLGPDYAAVAGRAFSERWIDLLPNDGKKSGAYSTGGAYDVHPYMLINYTGNYDGVSTVAHELGHTMHSYYSNKTQPYPLAGYPTFVAEVASTFNEALLIDHMLKQVKDKQARLQLLGNYLEGIKGTVVRQTQFAEFELRMHEMAQKGEPLTGPALAKLYLDITRRYYGHDQGVCLVDDYIAHEWSVVPHFYRAYYVFQYATSFTAASALSQKVLAGGPAGTEATKRYLAFLSAGGSKYPIDLLKDAGVDMTSDEPLDLTMREMNRVMDEIDTLLQSEI